jgi:hypothetical protein
MGEPNNPYDVQQDVNRALYGDPVNRTPGLIEKVDFLLTKMERLEHPKNRPNITNWILGYITFYASGFFAILSAVHLVSQHALWELPIEASAAIAVVLAMLALLFLLTGFGWIGGE